MNNSSIQLIRCRLGDDEYGFDMRQVRAIESVQAVQPTSGEFGVVGWLQHGEIRVPVVDPIVRLYARRHPSVRPTQVVILDTSSGVVGILADTLSHVLSLPADRLTSMPSLTSNQWSASVCTGVARFEDRPVLVLNPRLFDASVGEE